MAYSFNPKIGLYILEPTLVDGGLNIWTDENDLTYWSEWEAVASTFNREATEKIEGDYSARMDIDAANNNGQLIQENVILVPGRRCKATIWTKNSIAGKTATFLMRDMGTNVYLQVDGTWGVGGVYHALPSLTAWKKWDIEFNTHPDYTNYHFRVVKAEAASSSIYFDKLSIEEEVVGDGKTLMVSSVIFVPVNADGDRLILADYDDNKFVEMKGLKYRPNPIFFKKPRKLNGLKIVTIDSGKAYIYLAKK